MLEDGLAPEDVDAITGSRSATRRARAFARRDLVGLDTFVHVADNCYAALTTDEDRDHVRGPGLYPDDGRKKLLGDKTNGGFYKRESAEPGISRRSIRRRSITAPKGGDPEVKNVTKRSRRSRTRRLGCGARRRSGQGRHFAWKVLSRCFAYLGAAHPEIATTSVAVDDAMKWGYGWELGPFETWDALGFVETTARMVKDGIALPRRSEDEGRRRNELLQG